MSAPNTRTFSPCKTVSLMGALLGFAVIGAGCAKQQTSGYYDPPGESTITDAQSQGAGAGYRQILRAPSQLQIELKPDAPIKPRPGEPLDDAKSTIASDNTTSPLPTVNARTSAQNLVPQAQTYMGTLPCFAPGLNCDVQRITLTLAPNGRWRGRSATLDTEPQTTKSYVEQGCWDATDERPSRVRLMDISGNLRAEFVVTAHNVLRVRSVGGHSATLNYTLTRQPDLDAIDELSQQTIPNCP